MHLQSRTERGPRARQVGCSDEARGTTANHRGNDTVSSTTPIKTQPPTPTVPSALRWRTLGLPRMNGLTYSLCPVQTLSRRQVFYQYYEIRYNSTACSQLLEWGMQNDSRLVTQCRSCGLRCSLILLPPDRLAWQLLSWICSKGLSPSSLQNYCSNFHSSTRVWLLFI
jgi:hypothetical protein